MLALLALRLPSVGVRPKAAGAIETRRWLGRRTRVELIDNHGPNTLVSRLRTLLGKAAAVDIQVAFASAQGVGLILPSLKQAAVRGQIRIVTGLYQAVTEPAALWLLLKAQQQSNGRLAARLARDLRFHRKLYVFRDGTTCSVISGSSNLTGEGLKSSGEFNLLARLPRTAPETRRLGAEFDHLWSTQSVPLSADRIKQYAGLRPRRPPSRYRRAPWRAFSVQPHLTPGRRQPPRRRRHHDIGEIGSAGSPLYAPKRS